MDPIKIKAHFGPMPRDFRFAVGDPAQEIGTSLSNITISQGAQGPDFFPHVTVEVAMAVIEVEGAAEVEVYLPPGAREALLALGWLPPDHATPLMERAAQIVEAAYTYVDAPAEGVDAQDQLNEAEVALMAAVERHRTLSREIQDA